MRSLDWKEQLRSVHLRGVCAWKAGRRRPEAMFSQADPDFLRSIGCSVQEMYDFVEDLVEYGEPDFETVCGVQELRLDYLETVLAGQRSGVVASMDGLPRKSDTLGGIAWLPRLIAKARLKLRGEMPPELMYGCGGDRPFVRRMGTTLPAFLKLVWECGDSDEAVLAALNGSVKTP
jgi:hypothetical protein